MFADSCLNQQIPLDLQTGQISRTDLRPAPLNSSWIISGSPNARSLPLGESADGDFSFGLWDCTAGEFQFHYRNDEFVHILEGQATIRSGEREICLRPGDVAFFPKGLSTHWTVPAYVKKLATFRTVQHSWISRQVGRLKSLFRGLRLTTSQ